MNRELEPSEFVPGGLETLRALMRKKSTNALYDILRESPYLELQYLANEELKFRKDLSAWLAQNVPGGRRSSFVESYPDHNLAWYCANGEFIYGPYLTEADAWAATERIQPLSNQPWRVFSKIV